MRPLVGVRNPVKEPRMARLALEVVVRYKQNVGEDLVGRIGVVAWTPR